jgi:hypothetical protein
MRFHLAVIGGRLRAQYVAYRIRYRWFARSRWVWAAIKAEPAEYRKASHERAVPVASIKASIVASSGALAEATMQRAEDYAKNNPPPQHVIDALTLGPQRPRIGE